MQSKLEKLIMIILSFVALLTVVMTSAVGYAVITNLFFMCGE